MFNLNFCFVVLSCACTNVVVLNIVSEVVTQSEAPSDLLDQSRHYIACVIANINL